MPIHCGGTSALAYDFSGDPLTYFFIDPSNGAVPSQVGGEGVITYPTAQAGGSWAAFGSIRHYDLTGDRASVKVPTVPNPATTTVAFLELIHGGDYVGMQESEGTLYFATWFSSSYLVVKSIPYDAVQHLYWGISEDGAGTVHWQTSADGQFWVDRAQIPTASVPFSIQDIRIQMGGSTLGGEVNPGTAHFDDVNGGGAPKGTWCKTSTFTDDFDDGVQAPRWGRAYADPGTALLETGGELVASFASNAVAAAAYLTNVSFDMTGDAVVAEVTGGPNPVSGAQLELRASNDLDNSVDFVIEAGVLTCRQQLASVLVPLASTPLPPLPLWLRLREAGGTTFWESSADGKVWAIRAQKANVIDMTRVDVGLGGGTYKQVASPGKAHFDNYNLPPP